MYKNEMKRISVLLIVISIFFITNNSSAQRKYLFKWDEGSGHNMSGWTWYNRGNNTIYAGHPGWVNNTAWPVGPNTQQGPGPRSFELNSIYGSSNTTSEDASVIVDDRAPSTTSGGSFKIYDDGGSQYYRSQWWMWYAGSGLGDSIYDIADDNTNRWSFYIKIHADEYMSNTHNAQGIYDHPGVATHMGTYLCDQGQPGDGGCPYEGPGNTHYYFYMYYQPDIWIHTLLDRHPQHKRDSFVEGDDPAWIYPNVVNGHSYPMHFYSHLHQFYLQMANTQTNPTNAIFDEMYFYSTQDLTEEAEPNQNDESITSLWIGYDHNTKYWYTGWQDESYEDHTGENLNDQTNSTFVMRWSTEPITNANFNQANVVHPDWFTYPEATSISDGIRRADAWSVRVWTRFSLPAGTENNHHLYFAIKDVSKAGMDNAGTNWPWNKNDGHDSPSPYIKTIDYYLPNSITEIRADVDQNSTINSTDAMLTLRNSLGLDMSSTNWVTGTHTGDVNCDDTSNSTDAMLILRKSLGLDMSGTGWCGN